MIKERIKQVRDLMSKEEISYYLVPTSDYHQSEYVGEYFKARAFMSGFTGSQGNLLIGTEKAYLWTDGRYFVQAKNQLEGSDIDLMKMGEEGVPTLQEFLKTHLKEGMSLGFDGKVLSAQTYENYKQIAQKNGAHIKAHADLVGQIWTNRPPLPAHKLWILEEQYAGVKSQEKLDNLRKVMKEKEANLHILTSLYDIAWLLNLRGDDIEHVPVFLSFLVIGLKEATLYINQEDIDLEVGTYLADLEVQVKDYEEIYKDLQERKDCKILLDKSIINAGILEHLQGNHLIDETNPTSEMKAIKNPVEIANTIKAHRKDGIAMTKFMYYLKTRFGTEPMTEISVSDYLEQLRKDQGCFDISFDTIAAYGPHGAMMHYSATEESDVRLGDGFFLVDSGGHYLEGTTDITRTFALGQITKEQKKDFTITVRSNMNLANARFLKGTRGSNLDILAREPFWEEGMDYKCGTGHGVGHLLNVHEGPNSIRWRVSDASMLDGILQAGMITTDEPGVYKEGKYGIRIENELLCKESIKNENGQFMEFETITYCPIDLDAIDPELMNEKEKHYLNSYHKMVYEKISPYLTDEENLWLKEYTREI